jgi:hypothetical protein
VLRMKTGACFVARERLCADSHSKDSPARRHGISLLACDPPNRNWLAASGEKKKPGRTGMPHGRVEPDKNCGDGGNRTRVRREDHQGSYMRSLSFNTRFTGSDRQAPGEPTPLAPLARGSPEIRREHLQLVCLKSAPLWSPADRSPRDGLRNVS